MFTAAAASHMNDGRNTLESDSDRYLVILAPSAALNPTLDLAEVEAAMADDPASARADYLSQWRDDLSSYISRDLIENCVDKGVTVRPYESRFKYFAFDDPSQGMSARGDSYAAAVAHRDGDNVVLDWCAEWKPPFSVATVIATISQMLISYQISEIMGDVRQPGFCYTGVSPQRYPLASANRARSIAAIYIWNF